MNKRRKKVALIVVGSSAVLLVLITGLRAYTNLLIAMKVARCLVATVKAKEYVPDKRIPEYGEWRVHIEIDEFDSTDDLSSRLLDAEGKRVGTGKRRFTILSELEYKQITIGDKIGLKYQRLDGDNVEKLLIW